MRYLPVQVHRGYTPLHLELDCEDVLPEQWVFSEAISAGFELSHMWQPLRHRHEPCSLFALKRLLVYFFEHRLVEARTVRENEVCIRPFKLQHVAMDWL